MVSPESERRSSKGLFNNVLTNLRGSAAGQSTGSIEYEFAVKWGC